MKLITIFLSLLISSVTSGQIKDSLLLQINTYTIDDSVKINESLNIAYQNIGNNLRYADNITNALIKRCKEINYTEGELNSLIQKIDVYRFQNKGDSALFTIDYITNHPDIEKYPELKIKTLTIKSVILVDKGQYAEAIDLLYKSLEIGETKGDSELINYIYNSLGLLFSKTKDYKKSLEYFRLALNKGLDHNDYKTLGIALANIGTTYQYMNMQDSAIYYYKKAEENYQKINFIAGLAGLANNLGKSYAENKNYANAINEMLKALKFDSIIGSELYIINDYYNLGDFYFRDKNYKMATNYLNKCIKLAHQSSDYEKLSESHKLLAGIFKEKNEYKKALHHQQLCALYNDSSISIANKRMVQDIQEKYETEKKEAENKRLILESKKDKKLINTQRQMGVLLIILLIIVILISIYIYRERKRVAELNGELSDLNTSLKKIIDMKDRFFGIISHDLKSPFTSIIGLSEALRLNYSDFTDEERQEYLKALDQSANFTFDLLTNLLMWAKSQTQDLYIKKQKNNLHDLVYQGVGPLQLGASRKNIRLSYYVSEQLTVYVDRNTITTTITNLVNNAIKFTPKHGKISVTASETNKSVTINIIDSGVGMSKETIDQILTQNATFSTPGTENEMGTGLGYILIKEFVELNQGYMEISSTVGEGTKVSITLPKGVAL